MSTLQNTHDTLSVSPFGLPALPEGEPRALRADIYNNCILRASSDRSREVRFSNALASKHWKIVPAGVLRQQSLAERFP